MKDLLEMLWDDSLVDVCGVLNSHTWIFKNEKHL